MEKGPVQPGKPRAASRIRRRSSRRDTGSETSLRRSLANGVLNFGVMHGVANLTLATRRDLAGPDGVSTPRLYVTGDLRIPVADLSGFRQAIDKLMRLVNAPPGGAPSVGSLGRRSYGA